MSNERYRSRYAVFGDEIIDRLRPYYLPKESQLKWTPNMYKLYISIRQVIWERLRLEFDRFDARDGLDIYKHIRAREMLDEIMPPRRNE